jgi:hypothetical protein
MQIRQQCRCVSNEECVLVLQEQLCMPCCTTGLPLAAAFLFTAGLCILADRKALFIPCPNATLKPVLNNTQVTATTVAS